jgi:hypothetical protein
MGKMHADEAEIDVSLVRRLLAAQFPRWADLPVEPFPSSGTVNAVYRSVSRWIDGENPREGHEDGVLAEELAGFVAAFRRIDLPGGCTPTSCRATSWSGTGDSPG